MIKKILAVSSIFVLFSCANTETITKAPEKRSANPNFDYTSPMGEQSRLSQTAFKTNGMVRTDYPTVLGVGGTTYRYTRYGAWNSRTGKTDLFAIGNQPSERVTLTSDQIYYGRALRPSQQSVYDNRLTYALNFDDRRFSGFSVSPPDARTFGSGITMKGEISGATFSGTAESGRERGTFSGQFYGPNGDEFVGIARFSDSRLDFAFGGDLQR